MVNPGTVQVAVTIEAGADQRERDELTGKLRRELRRLDVDRVERLHGDSPPGTRSPDMAQVGELLVTLGTTATALGSLVAAVRSWLASHGSGTVKLTVGGDSIEISGARPEDQRRLVDQWIAATAAPLPPARSRARPGPPWTSSNSSGKPSRARDGRC